MPGVPSSRACEACRRQKKKCDETQPTCSRCLRLSIPCIGSGKQRYKFQAHTPQSQAPSPPPSTALTALTSSLIPIINPTTSIRYNMWASYGLFFEDIPSRLGHNAALDASVSALTSSHASFCARRTISIDALRKYSRALGALRSALNDPRCATSSETLCAALVLIVCQGFVGRGDLPFSGHVEGSAGILKARRCFGGRDEFERKVLLSLRGCVLVEGLCNDRIQLTAQEWTTLVESDFDKATPAGYMMRCLAHAPILLRRGRSAFAADDVSSLIQLRDEIGEMYVRCKSELDTLRLQLQWELPSQYTTEEHIVRLVHAYRHRAYGLGLSIVLIFNTMLSVLCLDSGVVEGDAVRFAEEAATLARNAAVYRPIGASYAVLCLAAAGAATAEVRVRGEIEDLLRDYLQDVGGGTEADVKGMLEQTGRRLRFGAGGHSRGCYNI